MKYYIRHVRTGKYLKISIYSNNFFTKDKAQAARPDETQVHNILKTMRAYGQPVTFEAVK